MNPETLVERRAPPPHSRSACCASMAGRPGASRLPWTVSGGGTDFIRRMSSVGLAIDPTYGLPPWPSSPGRRWPFAAVSGGSVRRSRRACCLSSWRARWPALAWRISGPVSPARASSSMARDPGSEPRGCAARSRVADPPMAALASWRFGSGTPPRIASSKPPTFWRVGPCPTTGAKMVFVASPTPSSRRGASAIGREKGARLRLSVTRETSVRDIFRSEPHCDAIRPHGGACLK